MIENYSLSLHIRTLLAARNERSVLRDDFVDLSEAVDIINEYVALSLMDDPYVHSSTILRIAHVDSFWQSKNSGRFVTRLARLIISTFLEIETWKVGDFNTPDECLREIFSDEYVAMLRTELQCVPVIRAIDEQGEEILVPDLFSITFLARAFGTIAETSREQEEREERRLFFPNSENIKFELVDDADVIGEEYQVSEFDEWASRMDFPWDEEPAN